jgi:hypothetical protein
MLLRHELKKNANFQEKLTQPSTTNPLEFEIPLKRSISGSTASTAFSRPSDRNYHSVQFGEAKTGEKSNRDLLDPFNVGRGSASKRKQFGRQEKNSFAERSLDSGKCSFERKESCFGASKEDGILSEYSTNESLRVGEEGGGQFEAIFDRFREGCKKMAEVEEFEGNRVKEEKAGFKDHHRNLRSWSPRRHNHFWGTEFIKRKEELPFAVSNPSSRIQQRTRKDPTKCQSDKPKLQSQNLEFFNLGTLRQTQSSSTVYNPFFINYWQRASSSPSPTQMRKKVSSSLWDMSMTCIESITNQQLSTRSERDLGQCYNQFSSLKGNSKPFLIAKRVINEVKSE